ncbi:phospholipid phosphatase 1-like isoform X2 [Ostrea edulis]|uniref:phospholipid phosphatase 1-like isoform X2 n=1 Tax=Ostrea edulis TaxID=37623 RepID=UPI0020964C8D|nr:phospholipid phosphatase 1-like isoform X2 [Ostrea edulis]
MKRKTVYRVAVDVACLASVALPSLILYLVGKTFHRGFYCDDESIKHPYKSNTIPTWAASFVGLTLPVLFIIVTEASRFSVSKRNFLSATKRNFVISVYRTLGSFLYGAGITQLLTDIAKYSIGRLRPHFYTVCKPSIQNCSWNTGYIEDYVCMGTDLAAIHEARLSFPSGHSSFTMYCMFYIVMYLQNRMKWRKCWLLRPVIQIILFIIAYYTSISRISDYMHHWSDVLGGCVLGITVSILVIFFVSDVMSDVACCGGSINNPNIPLFTTHSDEDRLSLPDNSVEYTGIPQQR